MRVYLSVGTAPLPSVGFETPASAMCLQANVKSIEIVANLLAAFAAAASPPSPEAPVETLPGAFICNPPTHA